MGNKLKEKARQFPPTKKVYHFTDKEGEEGSCTVHVPGERFNFIISRSVAENLLNKHGDNLPFDIMTPCLEEMNNEDGEWMCLQVGDLKDGKIDKDRTEFEIWLPLKSIE